MWKLTVTADADPEITLVVAISCLRSKNADEFAAIGTLDKRATPSRLIVNVALVAAVFATTMFVTTVLVADGTVYNVVFDTAAAVLASALLSVAIYFYFLLVTGLPFYRESLIVLLYTIF
jgi:hypothetical protein